MSRTQPRFPPLLREEAVFHKITSFGPQLSCHVSLSELSGSFAEHVGVAATVRRQRCLPELPRCGKDVAPPGPHHHINMHVTHTVPVLPRHYTKTT